MKTSVGELLAATPLPRLEARLLLMLASGLPRTRVMAFPETLLDAASVDHFVSLQQRRLAGEPIAYLLGEREFYGRRFKVSPDVLIPRPETEMLVDIGRHHLRGVHSPRILDLGTGSGIVAVSLALELPAAEVWALDVSAAALDVARDNAASLGARVTFVHSDWYQSLPSGLEFDLIVSNPPYIEVNDPHLNEGDLRFEPQGALTDSGDGLGCLRAIYADASLWLKAGGWVFTEHGFNQGLACRDICLEQGLLNVETVQDLAGLDRVTGGQR